MSIKVKAAFLSVATLVAISMFGIGIYSADASANHVAADGYGVIVARAGK